VLVLECIIVAVVTAVYISDVEDDLGFGEAENCRKGIKLISFMPIAEGFSTPSDHNWQSSEWPLEEGCLPSIRDMSWAPWWTEPGDKVILGKGFRMPLVVSQVGNTDEWLLLGCCRLIDATVPYSILHSPKPVDGYSPIMYGSAWDEIGTKYKMRKFRIQ
jgi:hypothetical protein